MTNTTGFRNTAVGVQALGNLVSGFDNIAIWLNAGFSLNSGEARNIDIDHSGVAGENATLRIGTLQTRTVIAGIHGGGRRRNGNSTGLYKQRGPARHVRFFPPV